jgi:hypothetical protein
MALWRDPLDELIDDLERTLPAAETSFGSHSSRVLFGQQILVSAILWGTPEDVERAKQDPNVKLCLAELEELGRRLRADKAASTTKGGSTNHS